MGEEQPETISAMTNMYLILYALKRTGEAIDLIKKGIELWKKVLGEEHPNTVKSMYNLCIFLMYQERYEEAFEISVKVVEDRNKTIGKEHPDTKKAIKINKLILDKLNFTNT